MFVIYSPQHSLFNKKNSQLIIKLKMYIKHVFNYRH